MEIQHALQVFQYENDRPFRIIDREGEPWFVLADVCRELDIVNVGNASARLDDDEKDNIRDPDVNRRGNPNLTIINESGLYTLVIASNKPEAKRFKKWLTKEVIPSIRKTGGYGRNTPAFIRRYNQNWDRCSLGHFSVINELVVRLWGRFEHLGHIMADFAQNGREIRPDVSVGMGFSKWLATNHPTIADHFTYYRHWTPSGEFNARQYADALLPHFREYVDTIWIPEEAPRYFNTRDPAALPHIAYLLPPAA